MSRSRYKSYGYRCVATHSERKAFSVFKNEVTSGRNRLMSRYTRLWTPDVSDMKKGAQSMRHDCPYLKAHYPNEWS